MMGRYHWGNGFGTAISVGSIPCAHVYICASVCACSCMCRCMCVLLCGGRRTILGIISQALLLDYCLEMPSWPGWLAGKSQESECLYSPVLAWENEPPHLALFMQVLMFEHGSSFLEGKHFADWNPPCSLSLLVHGSVVAAPENLFSLLIQRHVACSSRSHLASCQLI